VFALALAVPFTGQCQELNKQIVVEAQKIKNDNKAFTIKLATEEGKDTYLIGDKLNLVFTADQDCHLYLIDIGTSGKAHILFPNQWHASNKVEKGKTYRIPPEDGKFVFRVQGPEGTNYLKAIATLKPVDALGKEETKPEGPFAELSDPATKLKDVGVELAEQEKKDWTESEISIKVKAAKKETE
jgi:hypothetical protein